MPGEVVNLQDGSVILDNRGVNAGAIALADWLYRAAKSGEVVGIAVAYVYADGSTGRAINGNAGTAGTIGQLVTMATKLAQE